jgi:hypothetical protein
VGSILPGHEDLKDRPLFAAETGNPIVVTNGDGAYYHLMIGPTGAIKTGQPMRLEEVTSDGAAQGRLAG